MGRNDYDRPMAEMPTPSGSMGRLEQIIAQFDEALAHLESRIGPVLAPEMTDPSPGAEQLKEAREMAQIDASLDALHRRVITIRKLTDRVVL